MRHLLFSLILLAPLAASAQSATITQGHRSQIQPTPLGPVVVVHGSPVSPVAAGAIQALLGVPAPTAAQVYGPYGTYGYAPYPTYTPPPVAPPPAYPTDTSGDFKNP